MSTVRRRVGPGRRTNSRTTGVAGGGKNRILMFQTVLSVFLILAGAFVNRVNASVLQPVRDLMTSTLNDDYGLTAVGSAIEDFAQSIGLGDVGVFKIFDSKSTTAGAEKGDDSSAQSADSTTQQGGDATAPQTDGSTTPDAIPSGGTDTGETENADESASSEDGHKYSIEASRERQSEGLKPLALIYEEKAEPETPTTPANVTDAKADLGVTLSMPVTGVVTSPFGYRTGTDGITLEYHHGTDYGAPEGTAIFASAAGTVEKVGTSSIYGKYVLIRHSATLCTFYGHCKKIYVKTGDKVKAGKKIAAVGHTGNATGPHLHFEIQFENRFVNPEKNLT